MVAGDEESYVVFKDLFDPVISGEYKTGVSLIQWRLREFFGRKSTFFSSYISKDSPFSCDHFDGKVLVKG